MIYEFINPQDIPEDLAPGSYTTRVIQTGFKDEDFWVQLEYLGQPNDENNRCLFPLIKRNVYWEPVYNDTYTADDITDYHVWDEYKNIIDEPIEVDEEESISTGIE